MLLFTAKEMMLTNEGTTTASVRLLVLLLAGLFLWPLPLHFFRSAGNILVSCQFIIINR